MLFDWLVIGQIVAVNPAHAVRGPKHAVRRGKTPVLTEDQARRLLANIDTSTLVDLRDRALIGVMTYAFARIDAVVAMRVDDYYPNGKRWWVRLHEKGGKRHEMPAHHKLEAFIDEYLAAGGIPDDGKGPLFRSARGRTGALTTEPMHRVDAYRMIRRRTAEAGFKQKLGCHVFRATGITAYLEAGGTLENAQAMAAHEHAGSQFTMRFFPVSDLLVFVEQATNNFMARLFHLGSRSFPEKTEYPFGCQQVELSFITGC
jgi:site-specific recombinase XerC